MISDKKVKLYLFNIHIHTYTKIMFRHMQTIIKHQFVTPSTTSLDQLKYIATKYKCVQWWCGSMGWNKSLSDTLISTKKDFYSIRQDLCTHSAHKKCRVCSDSFKRFYVETDKHIPIKYQFEQNIDDIINTINEDISDSKNKLN